MPTAVWNWKSTYNHESPTEVFDCMLAEYLISYCRYVTTAEAAMKKHGVETLEELAQKLQTAFAELPKLRQLFQDIEQPLIPVLWHMEQAGITLDIPCLQKVGQEIEAAIVELDKELQAEVGYEINLNSAAQVGTYMADKLGVPLKKTKTGRYATNENEISQYAEAYPFIQRLLQYRELSKLRSTYVETLISKVETDGRIHTSYSQVVANTGRLSSTNPNLQNIPVSSEFGQKIKSCFVSSPGKIFLSFDYSQQELRILAHLSQEEALIKAFQENLDIHASTASQLFNTPYEKITREQRSIAKTINFGIIYGMSSFGLSSQLHIPVDIAQQFIAKFYQTYPRIKAFFDEYLKQAQKDRFVETILGRRRFVFEYDKQTTIDNALRRVLINYPIQGSAADLMKKAMLEVYQQVVKDNPDCQLLLQIHDDLVFEVTNDEKIIKELVERIRHIMTTVYPLAVPVEVEVKQGTKWGELEALK